MSHSPIAAAALQRTRIAIVAYPDMSQAEEFEPLQHLLPNLHVQWARTAAHLQGAHWVLLPSSSAVVSDLAWLRQQGLDAAVSAHVRLGGRVWGIGAGVQMLGEALIDRHSICGNAAGLGLLPLVTIVTAQASAQHLQAHLPTLCPPWQALSGLQLNVYTIHQGVTQLRADMQAQAAAPASELVPGMAWQSAEGNVWGSYWQGMLQNDAVLQVLWGVDGCAVT